MTALLAPPVELIRPDDPRAAEGPPQLAWLTPEGSVRLRLHPGGAVRFHHEPRLSRGGVRARPPRTAEVEVRPLLPRPLHPPRGSHLRELSRFPCPGRSPGQAF